MRHAERGFGGVNVGRCEEGRRERFDSRREEEEEEEEERERERNVHRNTVSAVYKHRSKFRD